MQFYNLIGQCCNPIGEALFHFITNLRLLPTSTDVYIFLYLKHLSYCVGGFDICVDFFQNDPDAETKFMAINEAYEVLKGKCVNKKYTTVHNVLPVIFSKNQKCLRQLFTTNSLNFATCLVTRS